MVDFVTRPLKEIPIICGGSDQAMQAEGMGIFDEGMVSVSEGSL
jgi:sugar (pentulose or hexulose) kinase